MRYCKFESYMHGTPPANWDPHYISPMIGDNTLYNMVPMDGSLHYLLDINPDGYDTYEDAYLAVSDALMDVLPNVSFGMPYLAPDGFQDTEFLTYLAPFFGQFNEYSWNYYYQPSTTIDASIGSIELTGGSRGTAAFMNYGTTHSPGGDNWYYMQPQSGSASPHFVWDFTVFPYDVFRTGKFDFSVMKEAVNFPGDVDRRRYCNAKFEIWDYEPEAGQEYKYQAIVYLYGYDQFIQNLNDYYQGTDTTVYDSGKPIKEPPKKKDDPPSNTPRDNDPVPIPGLPSSDMTAAGSLRIYTLSPAQVKQVFDYLHSHDPAAAVMKWWTNPMQSIISLHYLPYAMQHKGNVEEFTILGTPTGISNFQPAAQWQSINFGYLDVDYDSHSYLDLSPYTKTSIYLPGIGIRDINVDDIMGRRIFCVYHCDNVTGQFAAYIAVGDKNSSVERASVRYSFSGQVAATFPITQENWGNTYIAAATLAAGAIATGISAGAAAAAGGGAAAGEAAGTAAGAAEAGAAGGAASAGVTASGAAVSIGNSLSNLAKPTISRSGAVSGTTSLFAVKKPYLIIESPDYYSFNGFENIKGYPYGLYLKFDELDGYAVIEGVHLKDIPATSTEIGEIESLLKSGVHF